MKRFQIILPVLLCLIAQSAFAQNSRLTGRVLDKENGEPLMGVNVIVQGTYKGAATDMDGRFEIRGLAPGDYDLKASMMGYTVQLKTGIHMTLGQTTEVDFNLERTVLAIGQNVEVIGERPLLETDVTAAQLRLASEEIQKKTVENVNDLVGEQLGVVVQDNKIHIRGGRADESMYVIDGQSIKDPLSGYSNTLYVNAASIKELKIITGGYNAEYGQAMSGIVDIETKEGAQDFVGGLQLKTDQLLKSAVTGFNTDIIQFNLGGPELFNQYVLKPAGLSVPGRVSFFVSGYTHLTDTYLPHANTLYPSRSAYDRFAPRAQNDWHVLGKLSWIPKPGNKIVLSYDRSLNISQGFFSPRINEVRSFPYEYSQILDHYNTFTNEAFLTQIQWTRTLSPKTFYKMSLSRFYSSQHSSVQNKHWSDYQQRQDLEPVYYIPNTSGDIQTRFGDGFWDAGDAGSWYDYFSDNYTLKFDLTSQPNSKHAVKTGLESRYTEMQVIDINDPWYGESGLGRNHDYFRVFPNDGALYIQDRITYSGMIVNIGLRYDYWFPGKYVDDAIGDPETVIITDQAREKYKDDTFKLFGMRGKGHLSPRLGISHPITDNDVLYLYYGHFSQKPKGWYVYTKLKSTSEATYQLFGNPNLNPTTTVAYEMGLKHRFNANQTIEFRAYYKDMFDYPTSAQIRKFSPRFGNISFLMYVNMDYARARGVEIRFRRRYSRYFSGNVDFTYAVSTGKSSTPNTNLLVAAGKVSEKPLGETYLSWDRPFRISTDIYFDMPEDADFRLYGLSVPKNWGLSLRWEYTSGKRYTQLVDVDKNIYDKDVYSSLSTPQTRTDLKFYKNFNLAGKQISFFVEAENLLNNKIPLIINPVTGRPYEPGDVIPVTWHDDPRDVPPDNPARYDWPRRVITGIGIHF